MPTRDRLKALDEFTLADLEAVRLVLRGDSVIDWHRLNFEGDREVRDFCVAQEFNPDEPADRARMNAIKSEAINYLRRHFEYPIPKPVEQASIEELFSLAAGRGHRQTCACTILKCMHIIHHLDGRELLFMLPMSDQEIFHLVEEKVYRVIGSMLAEGFPITEFVGGRKNKDSLYTKLLSKRDAVSAQIFDKLRFRIVAREREDIIPIIQYLTKKLFPFNYVIPAQSINSMFHFKRFCQKNDHLKKFLSEMQAGADEEFTPTDNIFSADNYRVIHFVVDMPVRLPRKLLERAPSTAWALGPVVFVICEFQVIDRETEAANEQGEASHAKYKERQKKAVMRRLQVGMRELRTPPRRTEEPAPVSRRPERTMAPPTSEREAPAEQPRQGRRRPGPRSQR
ncbi:MAG: TIGR04552 family protein [Myxococcales bacterium 68-20]|nr:TIGR04552 family protein [Myxococcales bacterium]OJY31088.1 MAG: TIGR04552 family protein [Myxococcales bacterium 68-20]